MSKLQKERLNQMIENALSYKQEVKKIKSTKWGVSDSIAVKSFHELYSKKISINSN